MTVSQPIDGCRLCGSDQLESLLNFGKVPLANNLRAIASKREELVSELNVVKCVRCDCIQLLHDVDPNLLFSNYNYKTSAGLENHFKSYAEHTARLCGVKPFDLIVGIGGNTGMLEKEYLALDYIKVVNVEPAKNIAELATKNGVLTIPKFFNAETAQHIVDQYGKAKLITSNNCLAHTNLLPIIEGIKILLDDEGTLVFENAYWPDSVKNLDVFQVYAEHLFYHTVKPLKTFFNRHGLNFYKVEFNGIQNGSLRGYVSRNPRMYDPSVDEAIEKEEAQGIFRQFRYTQLKEDLKERGDRLHEILSLTDPKKTYIYGVTAKVVLLLKEFGIQENFAFAIDDSELKADKFIPGTKIQVKSRDFFLKNPPQHCLVGAYNLFDFIVAQNPQFNGIWIKPLPDVKFLMT